MCRLSHTLQAIARLTKDRKGSAPTSDFIPFPIQLRVQSFMLQDLSL